MLAAAQKEGDVNLRFYMDDAQFCSFLGYDL